MSKNNRLFSNYKLWTAVFSYDCFPYMDSYIIIRHSGYKPGLCLGLTSTGFLLHVAGTMLNVLLQHTTIVPIVFTCQVVWWFSGLSHNSHNSWDCCGFPNFSWLGAKQTFKTEALCRIVMSVIQIYLGYACFVYFFIFYSLFLSLGCIEGYILYHIHVYV